MGRNLVVGSMSRQECDRDLVVLENMNRRRRIAPGSERVDCRDRHVAFKFLKTSPADHGNSYWSCQNISICLWQSAGDYLRSNEVGRSAIMRGVLLSMGIF